VGKTYRVNEVFYSLQGEGVRAGTAAVFVRFSGCNLRCTKKTAGFDCDTLHERWSGPNHLQGGGEYTGTGLVRIVKELGQSCRWVIFTGGEPLLQLDASLARRFLTAGYSLAIETNGTLPLPIDQRAFGWIAVSPKRNMEIVFTRCNELRVVLAKGEDLWWPPGIEFASGVVSPAFVGKRGRRLNRATLEWCIEIVKKNPKWRLSVQQHKEWRVR